MTTKVKLIPLTSLVRTPLPMGASRAIPNTEYSLEYSDTGFSVTDGNYLFSQNNGYVARINISQGFVKFIRGRASEIDSDEDLFLDKQLT